MMSIDAAPRAEVVLRGHRVEAVHGQEILALNYAKPINGYRSHHRAFATAHRADASSSVSYTVGKIEFENHAAAMAGCPVPRPNLGAANLAEWRECHSPSLQPG